MKRKLTEVFGWHEPLTIAACRIDCVPVEIPAGSYATLESGELDFNDQPGELSSEGTWFATFADAKRSATQTLRQQLSDAKSCLSTIRKTRFVKGKIIHG